MHPSLPIKEFSDVERSILTITSILQRMRREHSPTTTNSSQIPVFLSHLATLLTCDDENDADCKKSAAITSSSTTEGLKLLVVTQNPLKSGDVGKLQVQRLTKSTGTFEEVMAGKRNVVLKKHISDIWAAIVSYNLNDVDQFHSFCDFIIARCFQEFSGRVFRDQLAWNVSVHKKIFDWKPLNREIRDVRWIDRPKWALLALPETKIDGPIARTIEKFGQPVVQWQLSNATLGFWAWLLATIIKQLELAVNGVRIARETQKGDEKGEIEDIHNWCHRLYAYLHWKEDVAQTLLTKTSLKYSFRLRDAFNMIDATDSDGSADMLEEPGESEGQQVLRHLKSIVAWHAAAVGLLNPRSQHLAQGLVVGLVEVTLNDSEPKLMTDEEVIQEYFRRYPDSSPEDQSSIENSIRKYYREAKFTGTTHAEATLTGLLKYFPPRSSFVNHGVEIEGVEFLKQFIEPATFEKAIAASKKCCWCCFRLGSLLGDIKLPGSHGVLYSWRPPRVGVDFSALQFLEKDLWDEMKAAVGDTLPPRHGSGSSTGEEWEHTFTSGARGRRPENHVRRPG